MANLSKREKFLVFLMALILPITLIVLFLIMPMQNEIQENRAQLSLLEIQKAEVETKITLIPTFRARKEERLQQVDDSFERIASPLHAAEFERWMLPLFSRHGVQLSNVSLSETRVSQPNIMVARLGEPMYRIYELIREYNEIVIEEDEIPTASTQLLNANYTYDFSTSLVKYMALLDEIKRWNTTFVVSDAKFNAIENTGSITITVYTVHKLEKNDVLAIYNGDAGPHPNETRSPSLPEIPK